MKDHLERKSEINISCVEPNDVHNTTEKPRPVGECPAAKTWPTEPKPLVLSTQEQLLWAAYDGALIALPLALIVKTGLVIFAHHYDEYNTGAMIDQASLLSRTLVNLNSQLVTLFTIVFVTIISTFVKRFALWKAQRGAYITDLEQYQGSVSLPSTLKLVWSLRSFGLKSVLLVLAWSFYYLGSQAVKLEYQLTLSDNHHSMYLATQRSDAPSCFSLSLPESYANSTYKAENNIRPGTVVGRLNTYFTGLLLDTPDVKGDVTEGRGADPSHGTKNGALIPDYNVALESMTGASLADKARHKVGGWVATSQQSKMQYITYTGTPIMLATQYEVDGVDEYQIWKGLSLLGDYTLKNISYLNITCGDFSILPLSSFPNDTDVDTMVSLNMTATRPDAPRDVHGHPLREFTYSYRGWTQDPADNGIIVDGMHAIDWNFTQRTIQTTCSISARYVDMHVNCLASGCYPSRMRWSNNTSEMNATSYSTPFDDVTFAYAFLDNLIKSTGQEPDTSTLNAVDQVVMNYRSKLNATIWSTIGPAQWVNDQVTGIATAISGSLTTGFNTYFKLSQLVVTERLDVDMDNLVHDENVHPDLFFTAIKAKGAEYSPAYRIFWVWILIDFISCVILLAAAVGSYWLRVNTLAPDIFGFVSSLTRGNPHIRLPSEGSTLSGIERARMLKNVKVQLGNVQEATAEQDPAGVVVLAPVQAVVQPLRPAHVYQ